MSKRNDYLYNLNYDKKQFVEEIETIIIELQKELIEKENMYINSNDVNDRVLINNEINILCAKITSFHYTLSLVK